MSYQFSDAEMARIDRLALGQDDSAFNNPSRPYSGVYNYILHQISKNNDPAQGPAAGIEAGIWQWFRGAEQINRGVGVFSDFIREYTNQQSLIRVGRPVSSTNMNAASDEIATLVVQSIKSKEKILVTLDDIGNDDARGMGVKIFPSYSNPIAGWSGNLLFTLLGTSKFFGDNITRLR
jgi:hypothetical protein